MSYDWTEEADGDGNAEKLPIGVHEVTTQNVVHGSGPKGPWVMVVVANEAGQEGTSVFTLTEKAGWKLARWLSRCGVDLAAMKAEGIEPKHFVNEGIANQYLMDKTLWVKVEAGRDPKYQEITPLKEEEVAKEPRPGYVPPVTPRAPSLPLGPCGHTINDSQCDVKGCAGSPF